MRRISIAILAAAVVAAVVVLAVNAPNPAWSAPERTEPAGPPPPRRGRPTTHPAPGRPGPRPGGTMYRRYGKPLTKEQEEEVLQYLKKKRPDLFQQATSEREKDPRRYQRTIRSMWYFISGLKSLPEPVRDAEEARHMLRIQMWRLAKELKDTQSPGRKKELTKQIHELADKHFDADQIIRQHRLSQLEGYIERLKRELKERAQDRQAVVRETVERMISSAERYRQRSERGPRSRPSSRPSTGASSHHKPPAK